MRAPCLLILEMIALNLSGEKVQLPISENNTFDIHILPLGIYITKI